MLPSVSGASKLKNTQYVPPTANQQQAPPKPPKPTKRADTVSISVQAQQLATNAKQSSAGAASGGAAPVKARA